MLNRIKTALLTASVLFFPVVASAQLDLAAKATTFVTVLDGLALPLLIAALIVGGIGYLFFSRSLEWAGKAIVGGIVIGASAEIAAFILA